MIPECSVQFLPNLLLKSSRHPALVPSPSHSTQAIKLGGTAPCVKAQSGQRMSSLEAAPGFQTFRGEWSLRLQYFHRITLHERPSPEFGKSAMAVVRAKLPFHGLSVMEHMIASIGVMSPNAARMTGKL